MGEIRGEIGIRDRLFLLTWIRTPSQDPSPRSKFRGDAPASNSDRSSHEGVFLSARDAWVIPCRHVSRISFRERPQLRGAPRLGGSEDRGPRVSPIKNQKVCEFVPLFFSRGPFTFLFSHFYCLILFHFTAQGGGTRPPWPPLDTSLIPCQAGHHRTRPSAILIKIGIVSHERVCKISAPNDLRGQI